MKNRSAPPATVTPILVYADVGQAIEFLCRAFGFTERLRADHGGSVLHAQLDVGECSIMLGRQGGPYKAPEGTNVSAYVLVDVADVDKHFEHAKANDADIVSEPKHALRRAGLHHARSRGPLVDFLAARGRCRS